MKPSDYKKRLSIIQQALGHREISMLEKRALAQASKSVLRATAKEMGLKTGEYDLRFNGGGSAVHGDATLHTDSAYVQLSTDVQLGVLVRSCQGRRDYSGGANQWIGWGKFFSLKTPSELASQVSAMVPTARAQKSPSPATLAPATLAPALTRAHTALPKSPLSPQPSGLNK
jgi:hypothetical protein